MKNCIQVRRWIALLLGILLLGAAPLSLCSCGKEQLLTLGRESIDTDLYRYWLSSFKAGFLRRYTDIEDTPESWSKRMEDGRTVAQYVEEYTRTYAENVLCVLSLCRKYGIRVPNEKKQEIREYIDEIIAYRFNGSRADLEAAMQKTYGIGIAKLQQAYEMEAKISLLQEYLYGEDGIETVDAAAIDAYYQEQYVHFQFLYINTEFRYVLNDKGEYQTDPNTGYYLVPPLEEAEREKKLARLNEAKVRLDKGEDFLAVMKAYSEMDTSKDSPEGFYLRRSAYEELVSTGYSEKVLQEIFDMQPGELRMLTERDMETNYPGSFLLQCLPLTDRAYETGSSAVKQQLADLKEQVEAEAFNRLLEDMRSEIRVEEALMQAFRVENVKTGLSYLT